MRRTKIVCTLGPATDSPATQRALVKAGMDVVRLNFSHGNHQEHARRIASVRRIARELGRPIGLLQDLSGPKLRVGKFASEPVELRRGQTFTLTARRIVGDAEKVSLSVPGVIKHIKRRQRIMLADGEMELRVREVADKDVTCVVVDGGLLRSRQGVNLPDTTLPTPAFTRKDAQDLDFGLEREVDWVAMSFVRSARDLEPLRRRMKRRGRVVPVIAKIEKPEATEALEEILEAADGLMVARGDLGVEMPVEQVPRIQKEIIRRCNAAGKPVITATQMLQSMIDSPRPARAEVTDIANAILDGTDAVMLSGETAIGKYPVQAAAMMAKVTVEAEGLLDFDAIRREKSLVVSRTATDAISEACVAMAYDLGARAILVSTSSGYTARMVSKNRPATPIVAVTSVPETHRRLLLVWGVRPLLIEGAARDSDQVLLRAQEAARDAGLVKDGDLVVITAGVPIGAPGRTNLLRVQVIGDP